MKSKLKVFLVVFSLLLVVVVVFFAISSRTSVNQSTEALKKLEDSAKFSRKIYADNEVVAKKMKKDIIYYGITGKYTPELEALREYNNIDASNSDDVTTKSPSNSPNKPTQDKPSPSINSSSNVEDKLSDNQATIKEKGEEEFFRAAPEDVPEAGKATSDASAYMESANIVEEDYFIVVGSDKLRQFIVLNGSDGSTLKITAIWKGGRLYEASAVAN